MFGWLRSKQLPFIHFRYGLGLPQCIPDWGYRRITLAFNMQDYISYLKTAGLWLADYSWLGHLLTFAIFRFLHFFDWLLELGSNNIRKMSLESSSSSLCHTHEKELDTACIEIYISPDASPIVQYDLFGQSAECQGCPLQSIFNNVKNGSVVKVDTRYGGFTKLSLLQNSNSRYKVQIYGANHFLTLLCIISVLGFLIYDNIF